MSGKRKDFSSLTCAGVHSSTCTGHGGLVIPGETQLESALTSPFIHCRRKIFSNNTGPWAENRFGTSQTKQLWPHDHDVPCWLDAEICEEQQCAWSVVHGVQLCLQQRAVLGIFHTNIRVCNPSFYGFFPSTAGMHKSRVRGHTSD